MSTSHDETSFAGTVENGIEHNSSETQQERQALAKKENEIIFWLRLAVFAILILTNIVVAAGVYLYTQNDQQDEFNDQFQAHASKVLETFHATVERKIQALDALSVTYTSFAAKTNATFPNVTLPDIEIRGANTRVLAEVTVIIYMPLVTDETRAGWEAYFIENRDYVYKSGEMDAYQREIQDTVYNHSDGQDLPSLQTTEFRDQIYNFNLTAGKAEPAPPGVGPYLPIWQQSPVVTTWKASYNFNSLTLPANSIAYKGVIESGMAVIDNAANLRNENLGNASIYVQLILASSQYRYDKNKALLGDPTSTLGYPVFDSFNHTTRKVVGVLSTNLYWKIHLQDILPPNAHGIICVIENSNGQNFTYKIDGTEATYIGEGDWHNSKYNNKVVVGDIAEYLARKASPVTRSYTSVSLNTEITAYTLKVYPSQELENQYVNNDPIIFMVVIVSVFLFTSFVFLFYDYIVARRQRIVMNRAVASSAIVSSLFPSTVRDQLYKENEQENELKKNVWDANRIVNDDGDQGWRPIAEEYKNTTILFADLVGFTNWSSARQPVQVFELLETIYSTFDKIASRHNVFKIETIGGTYT